MIRALTLSDRDTYRAVWLDGLTRFPAAFLLTADEARRVPDASLETGLVAGWHIGAFEGDQLIGFVTWKQGGVERLRHTGDIGPLYVTPEAQGKGIAHALLQAALNAARQQGLLQIELSVDETNTRAVKLYQRAGFVQIGRRPRSVIVDDEPRHDLMMLCVLDAEPA